MIAVGDKYTLEFKDRNWVLSKRIQRKARDTAETYDAIEPISYYSRIENACDGLYEKELEGVSAATLMELKTEFRECSDRIIAAIKQEAG